MAHEIPHSSTQTGLSRRVLEYSEAFQALVDRIKDPGFSEADWGPIEAYVDVANFERIGRFLTPDTEVIDWPTYKSYVSKYGGATVWEATLRGLTEQGNKVVQELEERNTRAGVTDFANTLMVYTFNDAGKLDHLEVYVNHLRKEPAAGQEAVVAEA